MLDDLRNSATTFVEEEQPPLEEQPTPKRPRRRNDEPFMGMTAPQRFTVALLMFLMVWVLGILFLIIMNKMYILIPGLS